MDRNTRAACLIGFGCTGLLGQAAVSQTVQWELVATQPAPRIQQAAAFDSHRGVMVMWGGVPDTTDPMTWEWDGTDWMHRPGTGPVPRWQQGMVYDSHRRVTVLFGGMTDRFWVVGETWEWDGAGWRQRLVDGPSQRANFAMAFDSIRGVTVMHGGYTSFNIGDTSETWEWDGESWTQRHVDGPPASASESMAFDSIRGVMVLFNPLGQTWEWDGLAWTYRGSTGPRPQGGHRMVFDEARGKTVFVGHPAPSDTTAETWEWDGFAWNQVLVNGPTSWSFAALAYDSIRQRVVLFGGGGSPGIFGDTWEFDGSVWVLRRTGGPSCRRYHAMCFDTHRQETLLFGGYVGPTTGDTWTWNGSSWLLRGVPGPSPRAGHAMCFDSGRGMAVLFGGNSSVSGAQTWEWNGDAWNHRSSSGPASRGSHAMAYDSCRQRNVLFGGIWWSGTGHVMGDTWEWDGSNWSQRSAEGPSARFQHAMAFDPARCVTVLFGGRFINFNAPSSLHDFNDTWEWNGVTWTERVVDGPSPRFGHSMIYDSARDKVVLFGGLHPSGNGTVPLRDTWEWDGTQWSQQLVPGPPTGDLGVSEYGPAVAYDSARGESILFGGYSPPGTSSGETWRLHSTACTPPTLQSQPTTEYVCRNRMYQVNVNAFGTRPFSYQWRSGPNREPIPGADGPIYAIRRAGGTSITNYDCVVTNACGQIVSEAVSVTVCSADFNCDGLLSVVDVFEFLGTWLPQVGTELFPAGLAGDFDSDGRVKLADLFGFLRSWFGGC